MSGLILGPAAEPLVWGAALIKYDASGHLSVLFFWQLLVKYGQLVPIHQCACWTVSLWPLSSEPSEFVELLRKTNRTVAAAVKVPAHNNVHIFKEVPFDAGRKTPGAFW